MSCPLSDYSTRDQTYGDRCPYQHLFSLLLKLLSSSSLDIFDSSNVFFKLWCPYTGSISVLQRAGC